MLPLTEDLYQLFENDQILVDLLPVRSQYAPRLDFLRLGISRPDKVIWDGNWR